MTGHIRAFRALARSIDAEAAHLILEDPTGHKVSRRVLSALSEAYKGAADALEAEEKAMLEHVGRLDYGADTRLAE